MDGTGLRFQGPHSWLRLRFHKRNRVRDHRRLSLLVGVRQCAQKFVYDWQLTRSDVGEKRHARRILPHLPPRTTLVVADPNYDAYEFYDTIERQGAEPVIKPRTGAREYTRDARGRSLRYRRRHPRPWTRKDHRRPVSEAVIWALKERFGRRLRTHGVHRQRREFGFRVIVYNTNQAARTKALFNGS